MKKIFISALFVASTIAMLSGCGTSKNENKKIDAITTTNTTDSTTSILEDINTSITKDVDTTTVPQTTSAQTTTVNTTTEVNTTTVPQTSTAATTTNEDKFTITFDVCGEKTNVIVNKGEMPIFNGTPKKESTDEYTYQFDGWDKKIVEATSNTTYTALFKEIKREYTYTFVVEGIELTTTANYGDEIIVPNNPGKSPTKVYEYQFDGWYTEEVGGKKVESFSTVTGNVVYYAHFIEKKREYTYTFIVDGVEMISTGNYGDQIVVPEDPVKNETDGATYEFDGWYIGDKKVTNFGKLKDNVTYIALFKEIKKEYTYTFVVEGIELTTTANYGDEIVVPEDPVKNETDAVTYEFDGWYTKEVGGEKVESFSTLTDDVIYYAHFIENKKQYTYTFVVDGVETSTIAYYGDEIEVPKTPSKSKTNEYTYEFDGWYIGDTKVTTFGTLVSNVTYTAKFKEIANVYTVTFNSNGGTYVGSKEVSYNSLISNVSDPTRDGYNFLGWYYNGALWNFESDKMPSKDITLNAQWDKIITYVSVTYYKNDIDGSVKEIGTEKLVYEDGFDSVTLDIESKYTHSSWYDINGNIWKYGDSFTSTSLIVYTDIYTKGLNLKVSGDYAYVSGYSGTASTVEIPYYYLGKKVTKIGYRAFYNDYKVTDVYLTENVLEIEEGAFYNSALENILNTAYVNTLGEECFGFSKIKYFDGGSLITIGAYCFNNCTEFTGFNRTYFKTIPSYAFYGCTKLESFDFRDYITTVGEYAFANSGLKTISNYSKLTIIRNNAFESTNLETFTAGNYLTIIEDKAFNNCSNLTTFYLSTSVKYVGIKILNGTNVSFTVKNKNKYVGTSDNPYYLYYESEANATSVTIVEDCYLIGGEACRGLSSVKKVTIPDNVKGIGKNAFTSCTKLATVTISANSNLRVIGDSAFAATAITKILLPYFIEYIGAYAFNQTKLATVDCKRDGLYYLYQPSIVSEWEGAIGYITPTKYTYYEVDEDFATMLQKNYLFVYSELKFVS